MTTRDVTFWVQLEPEWRITGDTVALRGLKVIRVTQRYPDPPKAGCDVVKLTLRVPASRLLPLAPEVVDVPEGSAGVEVVAEDES